jgi:hypothetical protein
MKINAFCILGSPRVALVAGSCAIGVLTVWLASRSAMNAAEEGVKEPPSSPSPAEKVASYSQMLQEEIELGAQQRLLTVLSEEHQGRAEIADKAGNAELSRWESELSKDLRARAAVALGKVTALGKQRREFEEANKLGPAGQPEVAAALRQSLLSLEESVYLERLAQRLGSLQQELNDLHETQRVCLLQMQTNNGPDEAYRLNWLLESSHRTVRDIQRQQTDLQLKQLEFRAMKK